MTEEQKQKRRAYEKEYRESHKKEIQEKSKQYYQEHRDEISEKQKQYYQNNKDKKNEQAKQWRKNNPLKTSAIRKRFYIKHREETLKNNKTWCEQHKEQRKEYKKTYNHEHAQQIAESHKNYYNTKEGKSIRMAYNYKRFDKQKNLGECTLTPEWIIDNIFSGQVCHWCGETDWQKLGCDRIDNSKPHTPDNVVPCCGKCNLKRKAASYEFFKMMHTPVTVKIWK